MKWSKYLPYFKEEEFKCPCCGKAEMSESFMDQLLKARIIAGVPFIITSGYRCEKHHAEIYDKMGKPVLPDSPHLEGVAADISVTKGNDRFVILGALIKAGFRRIGIGSNFIHVDRDVRTGKAQNTVWTY